MRSVSALFVIATLAAAQPAQFHLTARPWADLSMTRANYLDAIEGICRYTVTLQDQSGAIIDPYLHREFQYATPYFAFAVGTLVSAGRAKDLLPAGVLAMEHSTTDFSAGSSRIPDRHGEFFIPALTGALVQYSDLVPPAQMQRWRERMKAPLASVIVGSNTNNWQTYAMKGEWMRMQAGLTTREAATAFIEKAWAEHQRVRAVAELGLYRDKTSVPDTLSVEVVGRGNLLALIELGYDGPSAAAMRATVEQGSYTALMLQDPSGQVPANGRTDDHVWVDVGYQLTFEVMAERCYRRGDLALAGQYRRAALLAFQSIGRWRRSDGSFSVTKNHFDPALRVGHQTASQYTNYNGSLMYHLSEAYLAHKTEIPQKPCPAEIGGYGFAAPNDFATAFANAGGLQMQMNLRGQVGASSGNVWTPLGVVRFARFNWDTRLGPSDGAATEKGGITFVPAFFEGGRWLRLADVPARYEGRFTVAYSHPLLVRCAVEYRPKAGQSGPVFRNEFVLTPDGVLSTLKKSSEDDTPWAITWPALVNDGRPLEYKQSARVVTVSYPGQSDQQSFLALDDSTTIQQGGILRSTYGDLQALIAKVNGVANHTFVYPQSKGDPGAELVRESFRRNPDGFESLLGRVKGTTYVGRTSAGGTAQELDINGDGKPDIRFNVACSFVLVLDGGRIVAVETDRAVTAHVGARSLSLNPFQPQSI